MNTLVVNQKGESPVHVSAQTPHTTHILRYVLQRNPNLYNHKDYRGYAPDMYTKEKVKIKYLDRAKKIVTQSNNLRPNNKKTTAHRQKRNAKPTRMVTRSQSSINLYKKSLIKKHNKHD